MFSKIKKIIYFVIFYSGFWYPLRFIYRKIFNNPIEMLYTHRIIDKSDDLFPFLKRLDYSTLGEFEKKIKYLLKHYRFISLKACLAYLKNRKQPSNCILLTFDDGYRCFYEKAFPIFKKYNIPATVFITTDLMDKRLVFWYDKLIYAIGKTEIKKFKIPEISHKTYKIASLKGKKQDFEDIINLLKKNSDDEKEKLVAKIIDILKINNNEFNNINHMLSWDELRQMCDSGLVSIGAHTLTHPLLTKVSLAKAQYEIKHSKEIIEEKLNTKVTAFAYPNGDFNSQIKKMVIDSGYSCAFTTDGKNDLMQNDFFALGRIRFVHEPFYLFGLNMAIPCGFGGIHRRASRWFY